MKETKYWTWHMAAGVVIALLLGLHMLTMHLGDTTGIGVAERGHEAVSKINSLARDAKPIYPVIYVVLLGAALYHGLYGLRTILFELTLAPALETTINVVFVLLGVALFAIGTWGAFAAHAVAAAAPAGGF
jgi:succinate dehydrogenase hydrophobic anchor subunit